MNFSVYGHPLIRCEHKTTLEFTKDRAVTVKGDCIAGVRADYNISQIKKFCKGKKNLTVKFVVDNHIWELHGEINHGFDDDHEMVFRKSEFISERTLLIRCDNAAADMPYGLVSALQDSQTKAKIMIQ